MTVWPDAIHDLGRKRHLADKLSPRILKAHSLNMLQERHAPASAYPYRIEFVDSFPNGIAPSLASCHVDQHQPSTPSLHALELGQHPPKIIFG